ncbi:MAG: phosphodiester glycosidase family protein [Clostridia bacterium]|nr:phosphodiester glycosidase family protein [Clostridia bacterium]
MLRQYRDQKPSRRSEQPKKKRLLQKNDPQMIEMRKIRSRWHWGTFRHILLVFFTLILAVALAVVLAAGQIFNGPSMTASDLLVKTLTESSALKFVPYLFMQDRYVEDALNRNTIETTDAMTDVSLITVRARDPEPLETGEEAEEELYIETVVGATYRGYMMVVLDPSRVSVGVCRNPFTNEAGLRVNEIIAQYGAVGGINGGAFSDPGGQGNGGKPLGLVYSQGEKLHSPGYGYPVAAAFDENDILHVGDFTKQEAENLTFRDALAFGPALIINGEPALVDGGSGLNPRSAIGQRADGAVLLLTIDGRQANSLGASYADLIEIMLEYGAVNACNMDGGSSACMFLNGEQINDGLALSGSRRLPTAWIVK